MSTPQPGPPPGVSNPDANYRAILDYLAKRGHHKAALALQSDLDGGNQAQAQGQGKAVGLEDFAERNAPSAPRGASTPTPTPAGGGRRRMDQSVAPGQMLADPPSWERGYQGLRTFVENSLDIHRPELFPLLLPLFVHAYLDLVLIGCRDAADHFLKRFAPDHDAQYPTLVRWLASLRNPTHVAENETAKRWRSERYHVRLSERGWGLLLGWLQGGGLAGSTEGTEGRGRDRVLAIINERVKVDAVPGPPLASTLTSHGLGTDYYSLQHNGAPPPPPSSSASTAGAAAPEQLKLGPAPVNPALEREVKRRLKDAGEADEDRGEDATMRDAASGNDDDDNNKQVAVGDPALHGGAAAASGGGEGSVTATETAVDGQQLAPSSSTTAAAAAAAAAAADTSDLVAPFPADLPPYPSTFRTLDVQREVELVREARKRIRLGAEAYAPEPPLVPTTTTATPSSAGGPGNKGGALGVSMLGGGGGGGGRNGANGLDEREDRRKGIGKPSVCLFTLHDTGDSLSTVSFSEDSTIMATGFTESYIRLWSLNGKGLRALRTDLTGDEVNKTTDADGISKLYEPEAPQTRKLIAHSGPVYSLSFDPVPGPASPPRYLLSSSADCTVRLWSLETFTNLVVYRGHREPVWAVEWGPRGVYFATASRDRTARLWITDKINAVRIFAGHLSDVNCLSFHPNSLYLATGSSDRTCRLWDVQKGHCVRVFIGHRAAVQVVKVSPDGRYLASAGDDGLILLWSLATGQRVKTFWGHPEGVTIQSLSWSCESTVLVSGGSDETVRVWDVVTPPSSWSAADGNGPDGGVIGSLSSSTGGVASVGAGVKGEAAPGGGDGAATGGGGTVSRRISTALPRPGTGFKGKDGKDADGSRGDKGLGLVPRAQAGYGPCPDLLATLATKRTPVVEVKFTPRNLCLAAGPMREAES
ncbi:Transcription initiation factor TFIID subunit 5 [Rhodotorula mucilaginosa]|uniref:Transcription initiation factor TFIID subunit 5 n=1 Tax=Rhodotorula mucilaginosa TaxID=5537 RepID=A0A9P7B816_RHOMI|nr:Transcription initiation factor TFIID subunit 5 [Rhodotorula mucilaginosa]TKA52160.1 hypothetical protein B0A53_05004 [Rhodotorula sp. CCFEE 5036]